MHRVVLAAIALPAVVASVALAASSSTFAGKTGQKARISFRATPTAVSRLKTTVTVS